MRKLHTLLDGLEKLGRRRRAGGTPQHRNPPRHRLARVEALEDRHLLSLGDLAQILHNPGTSDAFGGSVAMSGDTVVVGAGDTTYVFDAGTGDLRWTLDTPGGGLVGVSESIVAVAAPPHGLVYIFDATTGGSVRTVSGYVLNEWYLGLVSSVAVSGNTVVVGMPEAGYLPEGMAIAFDATTGNVLNVWDGGIVDVHWHGNPDALWVFGTSVAASGDGVAIGAPVNDFVLDEFPWARSYVGGTLRANDPSGNPHSGFGSSVALAEGTLAVGAPGIATVYVFGPGGTRTLNDPTPGEGGFGGTVAVFGSTVLAGAGGSAYLFDATTGNVLRTLANPAPSSGFGSPVAASGTKAVVGAPGPNASGAVYVFDADTAGYPTDIGLFRSAIPENEPAGTVVGTFSSSDPESGDTFTYALASGLGDDDNASFTITGDQLRTSVVFDHETSCSVRVRTTDAGGRWYEEAFTIAVLAPPTANVVDVAPDPRPNPVGSIAIVFSHAVTGLDLADLTLTRDGGANLLSSSQTLSTSDDIHWTLGNLRGITDALGTYDLTLTAAASGIADAAGSALAADAADRWVRRAAVLGDLLYTIDDPTDDWLTTPPQADHFGYSVAVSGNSLVVGAPGYDYDPPPPPSPPPPPFSPLFELPEQDVGRVSPFDADTGDGAGLGYFRLGYFLSGGNAVFYYDYSGTALGVSVAISGDTLVTAGRSVWIYPWQWPLPDSPGSSVAMSGGIIVVGSPGDDTGATDAGSVYLYDAGTYYGTQNLLRTLNNPTPAASDGFGASVAISGNILVVGTPGDDTGATDAGSVYVFDATTGSLLWTLNNPMPAAGDNFGYSVAISGNTVVVGSPYDDTGATDSGAAYVFDAATGNLLSMLLNPTPAESDNFGFSVAACASTVLVGAPYDDTGATDSGLAYIFHASTGILLAPLVNPTPADGDGFGWSVALSETRAVVGAPYVDGASRDRGAVYGFDGTPPPVPDLLAASDTGLSDTDNFTRLDNSSAAKTLQFAVSNTIAGATVTIYAEGTAIGSATAAGTTTTVTTDGTHDLADGSHVIVARQTQPGNPSPVDSLPLSIIIATATPATPAAPDLQAASDTGVSQTDNVTADNTPTFDLSGASPYFRFYRDGTKISGDYESRTSYTTPLQPDGTYSYQVSAVDAAGNASALSAGLTVTIDTTYAPAAPDLQAASDTGVSQTDNVTADNTPTFDLFGAGPYFRFYRDGVKLSGDYERGTTYTTPLQPDGTYSYQVSAVDAAGNESLKSPPLRVGIYTRLTADVVDVRPDPRTSAVAGITIVFVDPVSGFDKADLKLTRNGVNVSLATATLTTTDNATWTLGNLSGLTGTLVGATTTNYLVTLTAAGSGITDAAGNTLTANASDAWQLNPATFTGTAGNDLFEFIAAGAVGGLPTMHQLKLTLAGSPTVTYLYDASGSVSLTLRGGLGDDTLRITGGPGMDTSSIYRYAILHVGPGTAGSTGYYSVYAPYADGSFETMVVDAGAGTGQRASLYNGPVSGDHFTASSWRRTGSMVGTGTGNVYNNSVKNFDQIYGASTGGGTDARANLSDSNGNDYFVCKTEGANAYSVMQRVSGGTGSAAYLWAGGGGFSTVYGYSTAGGTDEAVLNGSSGNDTAVFQPQNRRRVRHQGRRRLLRIRLGLQESHGLSRARHRRRGLPGRDYARRHVHRHRGHGTVLGDDPFDGRALLEHRRGWPARRALGQGLWPGQLPWHDRRCRQGVSQRHDRRRHAIAVGKPHATISGVLAGNAQLTGTGYWILAQAFQQVYVDMKTGNKDVANLYDANGSRNRQVLGQPARRRAERRHARSQQRQPPCRRQLLLQGHRFGQQRQRPREPVRVAHPAERFQQQAHHQPVGLRVGGERPVERPVIVVLKDPRGRHSHFLLPRGSHTAGRPPASRSHRLRRPGTPG